MNTKKIILGIGILLIPVILMYLFYSQMIFYCDDYDCSRSPYLNIQILFVAFVMIWGTLQGGNYLLNGVFENET